MSEKKEKKADEMDEIEKLLKQVRERQKVDIELEETDVEEDERVQQTLRKIDRLRRRVE